MPRVTRPNAGLSGAAIAIGFVVAALLLFSILDSRRRAQSVPAVRASRSDLVQSDALPPLYIPPEPSRGMFGPPPPGPTVAVVPAAPPQPEPHVSMPGGAPALYVQPLPPPAPPPPPRTSSGAALVVDTSQSSGGGERPAGNAQGPTGEAPGGSPARSRASAMSNRQTTVSQGTLIPAVLESALNSSGAGYARALVQRNVHGFDGSRVLIPRGSRLIGEYRAETSAGQKRAFVIWTRLIRPDGVTIAIGSPTTDPVGNGGVRARVNSHFFERFSGAILQSALDVGVNLAARSADGSVVVALPGSLSGSGSGARPTEIPPTLSVRQGTSVSVFVARDLDFTEADAKP